MSQYHANRAVSAVFRHFSQSSPSWHVVGGKLDNRQPDPGSGLRSISTAAVAPRPADPMAIAGDWPIGKWIAGMPIIIALTSLMPRNIPFSGSWDAVAISAIGEDTSSSEKKTARA